MGMDFSARPTHVSSRFKGACRALAANNMRLRTDNENQESKHHRYSDPPKQSRPTCSRWCFSSVGTSGQRLPEFVTSLPLRWHSCLRPYALPLDWGRETTMRIRNILLVLMLLGAQGASGQPSSNPISGMTVLGIYARKPADTTVYCLLGGGACLVPKDAGTADDFIAQWLISHPTATVIPVSSETKTIPNSTKPASPAKHREVFVWIADGDDVLNVALVREGYYTGRSMIDMVEGEQLQIERAKKIAADSSGGGFLDLMAKWRESTPKEDRPRRLVSDSDYALRMKEITSAEHDAQLAKRGIWSGDARHKESAVSQKSRESFSIRDLYVHGVNAHRSGDADIYCLIGGDFCLTMLGPMTDRVADLALDWPLAGRHQRAKYLNR